MGTIVVDGPIELIHEIDGTAFKTGRQIATA